MPLALLFCPLFRVLSVPLGALFVCPFDTFASNTPTLSFDLQNALHGSFKIANEFPPPSLPSRRLSLVEFAQHSLNVMLLNDQSVVLTLSLRFRIDSWFGATFLAWTMPDVPVETFIAAVRRVMIVRVFLLQSLTLSRRQRAGSIADLALTDTASGSYSGISATDIPHLAHTVSPNHAQCCTRSALCRTMNSRASGVIAVAGPILNCSPLTLM
jgi:hypothetical protein